MSFSTTSFMADTAPNVITESCKLSGSIRTFDPADKDYTVRRLQEIVKEICDEEGLTYEVKFNAISKFSVMNHPKCAQFVRRVAKQYYGEDRVTDKGTPSFGSEDFADYLCEIPGAFYWRINLNHPEDSHLHTPRFNFDDSQMRDIAEFWCHLAVERCNM